MNRAQKALTRKIRPVVIAFRAYRTARKVMQSYDPDIHDLHAVSDVWTELKSVKRLSDKYVETFAK